MAKKFIILEDKAANIEAKINNWIDGGAKEFNATTDIIGGPVLVGNNIFVQEVLAEPITVVNTDVVPENGALEFKVGTAIGSEIVIANGTVDPETTLTADNFRLVNADGTTYTPSSELKCKVTMSGTSYDVKFADFTAQEGDVGNFTFKYDIMSDKAVMAEGSINISIEKAE